MVCRAVLHQEDLPQVGAVAVFSEMTLTLVSGNFQQARLLFAVYDDGMVTLISFEKELSMFSELTAVTT